MINDLFAGLSYPSQPSHLRMGDGALLLRGYALPVEDELLGAITEIAAQSSFRNMVTPGGYAMSVAMTNCGAAGWVTDRRGYRYDPVDPETRRPWPAMPDISTPAARPP